MSVCSQELNHYESKKFGSEIRSINIRNGQRRINAKNVKIEKDGEQLKIYYTVKRKSFEETFPYMTVASVAKTLNTEGLSDEESAIYYPACYWSITYHNKSIEDFLPRQPQRKRQLQF